NPVSDGVDVLDDPPLAGQRGLVRAKTRPELRVGIQVFRARRSGRGGQPMQTSETYSARAKRRSQYLLDQIVASAGDHFLLQSTEGLHVARRAGVGHRASSPTTGLTRSPSSGNHRVARVPSAARAARPTEARPQPTPEAWMPIAWSSEY